MKDINGKKILPGMVLDVTTEPDVNSNLKHVYCVANGEHRLDLVDGNNNYMIVDNSELLIIGWFWDFPKIVDDETLYIDYGINRETANYIKKHFQEMP